MKDGKSMLYVVRCGWLYKIFACDIHEKELEEARRECLPEELVISEKVITDDAGNESVWLNSRYGVFKREGGWLALNGSALDFMRGIDLPAIRKRFQKMKNSRIRKRAKIIAARKGVQ